MSLALENEHGMLPFSHSLPRQMRGGAVDIGQFRLGMRALTGAVTVLTTGSGQERLGLTATAVCSLSGEPPRLLACVNQRGTTFGAMRAKAVLAVNVLSAGQIGIAERFAGMDKSGEDRFAMGVWREGQWGALPILEGACSTFECAITEIIDACTHGIVIADIMAVTTTADAKPLLYSDGRFAFVHEPFVDPRHAFSF